MEHHELELAFAKSDTKQVLRAYRAVFQQLPVNWQMSTMLDVRFSNGDASWMAGSYDRPTVWLDLVRPNVHENTQELMLSFKQVIKEFGGRPHFGKETILTREEIREAFPKFDEYVKVRGKADPTGVFANPFFDSIFSTNKEEEETRVRKSFKSTRRSISDRLHGPRRGSTGRGPLGDLPESSGRR